MPIQSIVERTGSVVTNKNGSKTGFVRYTLTDGRFMDVSVRSPSEAEWEARKTAKGDRVLERFAQRDADAVINEDRDIIGDEGEATRKEQAVRFLRRAYALKGQDGQMYECLRLFTKFNTYRVSQGWTPAQVQAALSAEGLTQDEWDGMLALYQNLNAALPGQINLTTRDELIEAFHTLETASWWTK